MEEEKNEEMIENEEIEDSKEETEDSNEDLVYEDLDNETFTYTVDNNNIGSDNKRTNYDNKKSYLYIGVGVSILIIIIVLLIILANGVSKKSSYNEIENKLISAAKSYYEDNKNLLPNDGEKASVDTTTLISNSYLKPFSELRKDKVSCDGYVEVYKIEENYIYFPTLDCGESYTTSKLADAIIKNTVNSGDGLYEENGEYIFKGEFPNNYVSFDGKSWRIIKINNDKSIKMILLDKDIERKAWDDRYNSFNNSYSGINDFRVSRALEYLENAYKENKFVSNKNKTLLVKQPWCIGKISQEDEMISNFNVCSDTYDDLYIGLVTVDEVLNASIDSNCVNLYDGQCTNYNYFAYVPSTWTLNASIEKSYKVFAVNASSVSAKDASNANYIRPVINVNNNVVLKKGTGTSNDPYEIGD